MTNGLILLGIIALGITLVLARFRRRLGMGATSRFYAVTITFVVIAVLILWATSRR